MADEKIITSSVFEQGITEIMQDIANNLYEFEEYTEEEVADLMDLSEEEVAELTRVINDTTVALNKVYSNKKVEDLLSELEVTCNKYADEKIGGLANIHLAYVDSLPSLGEDNTIYILKSTTGGNDTLNLYDGTSWISIGEFAISLDNYYDRAEVDALLNDKANVNEVVSQDDVVSDMSNISSSTVLSTAGLEVELNKKIDKDKIVTVLDDSVTDEQVPSAKAVVDSISSISSVSNLTSLVPVTNLNDFKGSSFMIGRGTGYNNETTNIPNGVNGAFVVEWFPYGNGDLYGVQKITLVQPIDNKYVTFERSLDNNNWMGWQRVCTTTVADVPLTKLTTNSWASASIYYTVKNGICFVIVDSLMSATMSTPNQIIVSGLPKPMYNNVWHSTSANEGASGSLLVRVTGENLINHIGSDNAVYFGTFSYPVAE